MRRVLLSALVLVAVGAIAFASYALLRPIPMGTYGECFELDDGNCALVTFGTRERFADLVQLEVRERYEGPTEATYPIPFVGTWNRDTSTERFAVLELHDIEEYEGGEQPPEWLEPPTSTLEPIWGTCVVSRADGRLIFCESGSGFVHDGGRAFVADLFVEVHGPAPRTLTAHRTTDGTLAWTRQLEAAWDPPEREDELSLRPGADGTLVLRVGPRDFEVSLANGALRPRS